MHLTISLLLQLCAYLVIAYILSKTPLILSLLNSSSRQRHQLICYILFSSFCVLGTYLGLHTNDAIANTRAIGAVIGGLLGGPVIGFLVGLTGGLHRYSLGGFTDIACAISTTSAGLIGGICHVYLIKQRLSAQLFNPFIVFGVTVVAEIVQMLILLVVAKPFEQSYALVTTIAAPMIIANSLGAALFISILHDRKTIFEKYSTTFSRRALTIANRCVGILHSGFTADNTQKIARIIFEETHVAAVAITDKNKILAYIGVGENHHQPNTPITSASTIESIKNNVTIYLDGVERPYQCSMDAECKLGAALIIPLHAGDDVIGTIKLYQRKHQLFSTINISMAEGIAQLLSSQILFSSYLQQKSLLTQSEIKLLQAQINPHFLFNALNTISAVIRRNPDKARELIQHLSHFFRSNLKQNISTVTLREELAHVKAYLCIEKARFTDRLEVSFDIDEALLETLLPTFTLQPLVENAIKHGISTLLEGGIIRIYSQKIANGNAISVEDNAGCYQMPNTSHHGLGLEIVTKRLTNHFGCDASLKITSERNKFTKMTFIIPKLEW